jgi:transglutaminase-like putative cysteine protease
VSGYLHPAEEPELGEPVVGESHAWVEWWLGEWTGHDPTNDAEVGERHVIVGRGRDYTDVPPIKGIVAGPAESDLAVTVEITRLA